jgi:hypothetical protein
MTRCSMTTRKRTLLLALPIFVLLAFVPALDGRPKLGWMPTYFAYPMAFDSIKAGEWDRILALATEVILEHIGLTIGLALIVNRVMFRPHN